MNELRQNDVIDHTHEGSKKIIVSVPFSQWACYPNCYEVNDS